MGNKILMLAFLVLLAMGALLVCAAVYAIVSAAIG